MNRTFLTAFAILAVALSMTFASITEAANFNPPTGGGSGESVVWAWGYNYNGQLGDGTIGERHTPGQVQNSSGFQTPAAGGDHSLALKNVGNVTFPCAEVNIANCTVWTWGADFEEHDTPVQVQNLSGVTAIATGNAHSPGAQERRHGLGLG
jgi:regulator of chromosome condensation (RCC1) repeat-containing protein